MRSHPILRGYIAVFLCSLIACFPASAATVDYKEGTKVNFAPSATVAGINVGRRASDPSTLQNGDIWYLNGTGVRIRSEGTTITLGAGGSGSGDALTTNPLSQFAATTSAQLRGVISDESGTGALVFAGGALGAATATSLNGLTVTTTTGTLTLANGKTLTGSNTLTLAGTDGSTLNIGAGGTLGAAALLAASAGGNGTADNGKAAIFGTGGIFDATTEITVRNAANAAHAYLADDGTIGFHAVGATNPSELVFPDDIPENTGQMIATRTWIAAQGYGSGSFDATTVDAVTWSDGANASNVWTFNLSGTDPAITFASGAVNVSTGALQVGGVAVPTISSTSTLTNKRITQRVASLTDAATVTPATDSYDGGILATLSQTTDFLNPTGTPTDFQRYTIRIKSSTARTITFTNGGSGTQYRFSTDMPAPTATSGSSLTDYMVFQWNAADSKWDCVGKNFGF